MNSSSDIYFFFSVIIKKIVKYYLWYCVGIYRDMYRTVICIAIHIVSLDSCQYTTQNSLLVTS